MEVTHHGEWELYRPTTPHPHAMANTMYARRKSDGTDWYDFVHPNDKFAKGSVIATIVKTELGLMIGAAVYEGDRLFPESHLIEIQGYEGNNPQKSFGSHFYDPVTNTISEDTELQRLQARGE